MTGTRTSRVRLGAAAATLLLLAAAAPARAESRDRGHGDRDRHHSRSARVWTPPLPPAPPRLPRLPHPRALAVPHAIDRYQRPSYSPYFAGRVFYAPYSRYLDVYYFPVVIGAQVVYRPYYYCDNRLFYGIEAGTPRFFFRITF